MSLQRMTVVFVITAITLATSGCISLKMVSVDEMTQLENQILGSFDELQKDMVMMASVRGEAHEKGKLPPAKREALMAMMNRQFNLDDIDDLKARGIAGEGRDGMLAYFDTERTRNDPQFTQQAKQLIKQENQDRMIILQRVININPNLSKKDLPDLQRMLYKLNVENSAPETKIQDADGNWSIKPQPVE